MLFLYGATLVVSVLVLIDFLPSFAGELSFTVAMAVTAFRILWIRPKKTTWSFAYGMFAATAAVVATANVAWVYGGMLEEFPASVEAFGATAFSLWVLCYALAFSETIFEARNRPLFNDIAKFLCYGIVIASLGITMGAVFALIQGNLDRAIALPDTYTTYVAAGLIAPALLLFSTGLRRKLSRAQTLIALAPFVATTADLLWIFLPESVGAMIYNMTLLLFWTLVYSGLKSHVPTRRESPWVYEEDEGRFVDDTVFQ